MKKANKELDFKKFFPEGLRVESVDDSEPDKVTIRMRSITRSYICPECGAETTKHQGTHRRRAADLPILGKRVSLDINLYDYICENPKCKYYGKGRSEDFNGFLDFNSRRTERLNSFILTLALETSCETCSRILEQENVLKISGDTIIRMLVSRYEAQPNVECGDAVGIDDFSFKRRQSYGTVIVDEKTHKPVAVLEGRDGTSLRDWLRKNQQVRTVTRDRASAYAKAVEEVLPDCIQVADRFHIHQNLLEAVNKILGREFPATVIMLPDQKEEDKNSESPHQDTEKTENKELSTTEAELLKKESVCCG